MKKALLTLSFIFSCFSAFPQAKGFYTEIKDPEGKSWRVGDVIETENGFLFSLRDKSAAIMESKMVKMSLEGVLLDEISLASVDTIVNLCNLFPFSDDSDFVVGLGVCTPPNDSALLLRLCFDGELNQLSRSLSPLPSPDHIGYWLDDYRFLQAEDGYYAVLTYKGSPKQEMKLCKLSDGGFVTQTTRIGDTLVYYVASLFHVHDALERIGVFAAKQIPSLNVTSCVLLFDSDLQLINNCNITNWYEDDGLVNIYESLSLYNSTMCPSPDGGYYISSRLDESALAGTTIIHDQSSVLAKMDSAFQFCPQYCVLGQLNDTVEAPSFYRSVDVNDEGQVYQCSMQNLNYGSWPYGNNGTHLVVTKTDTDLNIVWQKRFLKDGNIYSAFQTIATSDGGCLILGNVYDHNSELRQDVFALKINADGTIGVDEIQEESMAFVYPNPAKEIIRIGGMEAKETYVYNTLGQCVMSFRGNEADAQTLSEGVYLLRITNGNGLIQTLRLVVNK